MKNTKVVIVGAGPSGLGCAALLKQMGIKDKDLMVLEANTIGHSFEKWPKEMKMITPSFPSNGYHQTDLNAITPDTSPAFSVGKEHPTGAEYAQYLRNVTKFYQIEVTENSRVEKVFHLADDSFELVMVSGEIIKTSYLIWAGGEFSNPRLNAFEGSKLCVHNSQVKTWDDCTDEHYAVIGCYESGVDAAFHLAQRGKKVSLIESGDDQNNTYDPSKVLSPYTAERLASMANSDLVELHEDFEVLEVRKIQEGYEILSTKGDRIISSGKPINCTGFDAHLGPVESMFTIDDHGFPIVNNFDESTRHRNLFLVGPKLIHGEVLLCFIYKFRGRFALPCEVIGSELDLDTTVLSHYKQAGMLLNDLSCCEDQQCFC